MVWPRCAEAAWQTRSPNAAGISRVPWMSPISRRGAVSFSSPAISAQAKAAAGGCADGAGWLDPHPVSPQATASAKKNRSIRIMGEELRHRSGDGHAGLDLDIEELPLRVDLQEDVLPVLTEPHVDRTVLEVERVHQFQQERLDLPRQWMGLVGGVHEDSGVAHAGLDREFGGEDLPSHDGDPELAGGDDLLLEEGRGQVQPLQLHVVGGVP